MPAFRPARAGLVVGPPPRASWTSDVAAAALTRGTAVTTVTYGRACAQFMALTRAELESCLIALNLTAAAGRGPQPGC